MRIIDLFLLQCSVVPANTKFSTVNVLYINITDIINEILFLNSRFLTHICSGIHLSL